MKIPKEHRLPHDFIVGHIRFRKGVQLETVRQAAERWHKLACEASEAKLPPGAKFNLNKLIAGITPDNLHDPIE